jgi:predicted aspartyl protease
MAKLRLLLRGGVALLSILFDDGHRPRAISMRGARMVKRFIAAVPVTLVLFGCAAQTTWVKPGLTQDQFAKDRYGCMQQSQQRVSSAYVDQYGGGSVNHVITNANLFNACMNAQGYSLQKQASVEQAKAAFAAIESERLALCATEEVQPYYSKSACRPEDTTLEQMADKSRITNTEKVALSEVRSESKKFNKEWDEIFRQYYPELAPKVIGQRQQMIAEQDSVIEDFYQGRITRGEYNKRRMEIANNAKRELGNPDEVTSSTTTSSLSLTGATLIPVKAQGGGTYVVPVLINKAITLNFVIDSGASDVSIPADVVLTLVRSGTVLRSDFIGTKTYTLADGSTVPSTTFRIRSLTIGNNVVIENVTGSIAPVRGELLLGQSFLSRFKSWSIDNAKQALVLAQ